MSILKSVETEISGRKFSIEFPDKKTIILRGRNAEHILYVLETLLSCDFTDYYYNIDKNKGYDYKEISGLSSLKCEGGSILGKDKIVHIVGDLPLVHCVRYLGKTNQLRSFIVSEDNENYKNPSIDMRTFNTDVPMSSWIQLIIRVNNIVGFEMVKLEGDILSFFFREDYHISVEGQKAIYMLMAECFLTPMNFSRVLLIPDIPYLQDDVQIALLESLDDIKRHSLTLSTANIQPSSLSDDSTISFLNV